MKVHHFPKRKLIFFVKKFYSFVIFLLIINCQNKKNITQHTNPATTPIQEELQVGAARFDQYLPLLNGKKVAAVVNPTSRVGSSHLVDTLLAHEVQLINIFAPEHGFRGTADAGEKVADGVDTATGLPLISLYGKNKKPTAEQLAGLDWVIFDIQDVGARFYTYISTLHYVMEACAENGVGVLVLDRPNPNGHYVDGMVLNTEYQSFVGMHPVPVVHGMTIGEYAQMINGEGWLEGNRACQLKVVTCKNYTHQTPYQLPVKPSPNLPNQRAIYLYPSLCFFEGTEVSVGRGTNTQFQVYGHPAATIGDYQFTPTPMPGAKYPKHEGKACRGYQLTDQSAELLFEEKRLNLSYLLAFYQTFPDKNAFFIKNNFFDKLAGGKELRRQIIDGWTEEEIRQSWEPKLSAFKQMRKKYLLYKEG